MWDEDGNTAGRDGKRGKGRRFGAPGGPSSAAPAVARPRGPVTKEKMLTVAKRYAVNVLSARQMTESQMRRKIGEKLVKRFADEAGELDTAMADGVVDEVLALCKDYSFIDDASYARSKAASGIRRGKSSQVTAFAMKTKGLTAPVVAASVEEYDDLAAALNFFRRKRAGPWGAEPLDEDRKKKLLGGFMRSGFSYGLWSRALAMELEEAEDYLSEAERSA